MKKLLAIAALLLASSAAQAQYTFDYGGRTIRIDPDRGTVQIPGVYDNTPKAKRSRNEDGDRDRPRKQSPQQAKTDSQTPPDTVAPATPAPAPPAAAAPAPAEQAAVPAAPAPVPAAPAPAAAAPVQPATATAAVAPAEPTTTPAPPPPSAPAPQVQQEPPPAPRPAVAAVTPPPAPPAPAPQQAANSPLGVWLTEEKEGKVRIEQCGANLCGYSVDKKSNRNGEQVLINMKPGKDSKWSGRILDPNSGSTYDSTIALKGSDSLRVQGCAFGGMFCGGQTWTRVN
ncbi:DUF2147 domain-containing protein [Bradyrhizobium sp. LjRoot220]|uniref:DUF2147 domain-containing protein n=1 Tax=Bradyrhizobium sp. LjRoot220 TaxID=3342284 RepID=UPI003ECEBAAC